MLHTVSAVLTPLSRLQNNNVQFWKLLAIAWCNKIYLETCSALELINIFFRHNKGRTDECTRVRFSGDRLLPGSGMWLHGYWDYKESSDTLMWVSGVRTCCQFAGCQEWGSTARVLLSGVRKCCQGAVVRSEEVLSGCCCQEWGSAVRVLLSGVRKCCKFADCQEWGSAARMLLSCCQ
jgi:hypothetical protein